MTQKEIIVETIEYYSKNQRAYINGECQYLSHEGNKCAFARCCTDEAVKELNQKCEGKNIMAISKYFNNNIESFLKDEYKGHDLNFWVHVQRLHDSDIFWGAEGVGNKLTDKGEQYLKDIFNLD